MPDRALSPRPGGAIALQVSGGVSALAGSKAGPQHETPFPQHDPLHAPDGATPGSILR